MSQYAAPEASLEAVVQGMPTGLTGTLGVRIRDNQGADTLARTTAGIAEDIAGSGIYRATLTAPATAGQYTIVWDSGGATPDYATEDLIITGSGLPEPPSGTTYTTVDELARILKIRQPTAEQTTAMERVLVVAAGEIDAEIDLVAAEELAGWQLSLAAEVNLERAVEHWRQQETPFGLMVLGVDTPAERTGRDSWERHALKLAPLKSQYGFA